MGGRKGSKDAFGRFARAAVGRGVKVKCIIGAEERTQLAAGFFGLETEKVNGAQGGGDMGGAWERLPVSVLLV